MKVFKILFVLLMLHLTVHAQYKENVTYTKKATYTGAPIIQDTCLVFANAGDTLRIRLRGHRVTIECNTCDSTDVLPKLTHRSGGGGSGGGVSSVGLLLPVGEFSISGSPVTATGTLTGGWVSQSGNQFLAAPDDGSSGTPSFRTIVPADIADGILPLDKLADMAAASVIYRKTSGSGPPEVNSLATLKTDLGLTGTNSGDATLTGENYLSLAGQIFTANSINLSGTHVTGILAAARFPALTGDVTTPSGSLAATIANDAVTPAKMANMPTSSLIYRRTAGTGDPEVNTLAQLKTDLLLTGTNSGDVTVVGENYLSLAAQILTANPINLNSTNVTGRLPYSKINNLTGLCVLGNAGTSVADAAAIVGTANQVLRINSAGTSNGYGSINLASSAAVTGLLDTVNMMSKVAANIVPGPGISVTNINHTYIISATGGGGTGDIESDGSVDFTGAETLTNGTDSTILRLGELTVKRGGDSISLVARNPKIIITSNGHTSEIKSETFIVPAVDMATLGSSPVTLIGSPGANAAIEVVSASARMVLNTTNYGSYNTVYLKVRNAVADQYSISEVFTSSAPETIAHGIPLNGVGNKENMKTNEALQLRATSDDGTGDSDGEFHILYQIIYY